MTDSLKGPRDWTRIQGVFEVECPHCQGDGLHHGPVPYRNCIRCGGWGTIVLLRGHDGEEKSE